MRSPVPLLAVALLVAGPLPLARAEEAQAFSGAVVFGADLHLRGEGFVAAPDGVLDLTTAILAGEAVSLSWQAADGYDVKTEWVHAKTPQEPVKHRRDWKNDTVAFQAGSLLGVACGERCQVAVVGLGEGARVALAGRFDGSVRSLSGPAHYWAEFSCPGTHDSFYHQVPAGSFAGGPGGATPVYGATAAAEGRVGLFLRDATATLHTAGGPVELGSLHRVTSITAPGVGEVGSRALLGFTYLELEGASLSLGPGTEALFLAPAPQVEFAGTLASPTATGELEVGGRTVRLDREALLLEGTLRAALGAPPVPAGSEVCATEEAPGPLQARARPDLDARLEGEATGLAVAGQRVVSPSSAAPAVAASLTAAALVAAAAWLVLKGGGLAPFYSRISLSSVLANPRRSQIHELLRERPGLTATELAAATDLARVVVQHHLRMLETHNLIATRQEGRRRAYFLVGHVPPAPVLQGQAVLRDATRKRIAEAIALAPEPVTQGALVEGVGVSQRLVSYHLSHLEACGLVESEGRLPRRYRPTSLLEQALGAQATGAA